MSDLPAWFERELMPAFKANVASVFLLHGDVAGLFANPDEAPPYVTLDGFFERIFDTGEIVVFYDLASGLTFLRPEMERALLALQDGDPIAAAKAGLAQRRGAPKDPETALPLIEKALRAKSSVAVIIASAHFVAPAVSAAFPLPQNERANIQRLLNWAHDDDLRKKKNMVVLVTDQAAKVSSELRLSAGGIPTIFIPKPSEAERTAFLQAAQATNIPLLARASQGLSLKQLQDVLAQSGGTLDEASLKRKKREILNVEYGDVMELVEPARGLADIGGSAHIKAYFQEVLSGIRGGDARLVPMGVTLMGPPGTGKTAIVEALAKEAGFNFVKTKNVRSMWVGESEARMEKLLYGLKSLAPVVVMNDEADLAEGGRDSVRGDSGVSERLMKMWMELLSDPKIRGQIIVINCTNRPDRIDAALKRSGRSDERILMAMPSLEERAAIFSVQMRRHAIPSGVTDFAPFARATDGLSGADIERLVLSAFRLAKGTAVTAQTLDAAIKDFIPSASQAEIDAMTIAGLAESSSRRLLPENTQEIVDAIAARGLVDDLEATLSQLAVRNIITVAKTLPSNEGN
ncbi:MAG: ATP-binding protein [Deltaproteobacteria bacterium]|nr:ATP-binding protein [Deltaproteobacteria bacterium]